MSGSEDDWEDWRLTIHEGGHTANYDFAICGVCKALTLREDACLHAAWHEERGEGD